jgi:hypothetical protein
MLECRDFRDSFTAGSWTKDKLLRKIRKICGTLQPEHGGQGGGC